MNGQGKLEIIALVVSSIVIVGMALVLGITFYLYSKYKKKHIDFGHEDNEIKKETKEKYSKYISMKVYDEFILPYKSYEHLFYKIDTGIDLDAIKQETKTIETSRKTRTSFDENEKYDGNYELYLQELVSNYEVKEEIKPEVIVDDIKVKARITVSEAIKRKEKKKEKSKTIMNYFALVFYFILFVVFGITLAFKVNDQTLFIGNTSYITILTGSMESIYEGNTYISDNNLTNQIEQYSLIGIEKINEEDIKLYDVIAYKHDDVIYVHRVIKIMENAEGVKLFTLRGDANSDSLTFELGVRYENIVGKYNGFSNYGLGVTLIYLQSNIGIVALLSGFLFLIMFDFSEERIENSYDSREIYIAKEIDSEISKLDWEKNLNNEKE